MKVKEILNMEAEKLQRMMTDGEFNRMKELGFEYTWQLLDMMKDGVRASDMEDDEEYTIIYHFHQ